MIEVKNLTKVYKNGKGVFNLNFSIKKGEVLGFLGPNGAGKTTTIRNLLGFIKPNKGTCKIKGLDCWKNAQEIQKYLGYIPGETAFFDEMTGFEFLEFIGKLRNLRDTTKRDELINRLELDTSIKIRRMSKGMKQKIALITAFMHDPEILILDEPTSGLDPLMQNLFIEFIKEEKQKGKTILMSSHNFEEVERTCDRVAIINNGKIVAVEEISKLKAAQQKKYLVRVASKKDVKTIKNSNLNIELIDALTLSITIQNNYNDFINTLSKCNITDIDTISQSLEEIFLDYYRKENNND
jgi:ABC-2 type transport system ATP-binding protein